MFKDQKPIRFPFFNVQKSNKQQTLTYMYVVDFFLTDIDECAAMTYNCSDGFVCENIHGNYTCVCPEGYTGLFCETGMNIQCMQIHMHKKNLLAF